VSDTRAATGPHPASPSAPARRTDGAGGVPGRSPVESGRTL
jgi:hypothetical protein